MQTRMCPWALAPFPGLHGHLNTCDTHRYINIDLRKKFIEKAQEDKAFLFYMTFLMKKQFRNKGRIRHFVDSLTVLYDRIYKH